jgi:multimeric flavodoxin WrbA
MNVLVILGSQRTNGKSSEIENIIKKNENHDIEIIKMSEIKVEGCIACEKCGSIGKCILPETKNDNFEYVFMKMKKADAILLITPIYSPYPSRLTALMERLLSISFFGNMIGKYERPLKNKKVGIICYGSTKIEDDKQLKLLFQKYLMDNYSFTEVNYRYINNEINPNEKYKSVCDYVEDVINKI